MIFALSGKKPAKTLFALLSPGGFTPGYYYFTPSGFLTTSFSGSGSRVWGYCINDIAGHSRSLHGLQTTCVGLGLRAGRVRLLRGLLRTDWPDVLGLLVAAHAVDPTRYISDGISRG